MDWEAHCPDAGGRLPVVPVPTPMIKPAAASACKGQLFSFLFSLKVCLSCRPHSHRLVCKYQGQGVEKTNIFYCSDLISL